MRQRGFEIAKGYEDKDIHMPVRKTAHSAGYDVEAAEDVIIPKYYPGIKPDDVLTFDEIACKQGIYGVMKENEFMNEYMKL